MDVTTIFRQVKVGVTLPMIGQKKKFTGKSFTAVCYLSNKMLAKRRAARTAVALASFLVIFCLTGKAQTLQGLPEIDTYVKLDPDLRFTFQVKETREGGDPTQAELGPSLAFYLKPLVKLKGATEFVLDDSKSRLLVLTIGYRYLPEANGAPGTNRLEPVATLNFPMKSKFLLSDRNRADIDWQNGSFSWRYRNRFQVEKTLRFGSYHPAPYVSVEFFYESQYNKWSDTALYAGCLFPIGKHLEFDPYYEHQNNTGKSPNQQLDQLGIILNLFFSVK
jgi:hypothetical protein